MPTIALPLHPPKSKLKEMPVVDDDLALDADLTKMNTAGEIATQHIVLACEFLTPQGLEWETDPLTFTFFEQCCDGRAAIDSSQIPNAHQAALYQALEKAGKVRGNRLRLSLVRWPSET